MSVKKQKFEEFQTESVSEENIRFSKGIKTGQYVPKYSVNLQKKSETGFKDTVDAGL